MTKLRIFAFLLVIVQFLLLFSTGALADDDGSYALPGAPDIDAAAALLLDIDSGTILYAKNPDKQIFPASLTKIMTTMLALKYGNPEDMITVSASALENIPYDASTVNLIAGEQLSLEDLLYCVMVPSANEACNVVAEYISGSISAFVELMNAEAAALGCQNTHFMNPNGLHDKNHYTTARDLGTITMAALQYPDFVTICNTASKELPATNLSEPRYLKTTNYLISNNTVVGYLYSKACGVKTGYTDQAGHCLISTAKNGTMSLLSVIAGARSVTLEDGTTQIQSFSQTADLFDYGFSSFKSVTVLQTVEMLAEIPVTLAAESETVILCPREDIKVLLPKDYDPEKIEKTIRLIAPEGVEAPVNAGDVLGYVTVCYDGTDLGTIQLCAITDVARSELDYLTSRIQTYLDQHVIQIVLVLIAGCFVGYIIFYTIQNYRRRKSNRRPR